jgi:hypothetical protein
MISPHPSYPPLEMAAFGMQVLTNRYKSKDLSEIAPNIHSLIEVSPSALASRLAELVYCPVKPDSTDTGTISSTFFKDYIHGTPDFDGLAETLRVKML